MKTPVLAARLPAAAAQNDIPLPGGTGAKYRKMNTYAKPAANPRGIRTSKLIRLKVSWNEHLQKMGVGEVLLLPSVRPRHELDAVHFRPRPLQHPGIGLAHLLRQRLSSRHVEHCAKCSLKKLLDAETRDGVFHCCS